MAGWVFIFPLHSRPNRAMNRGARNAQGIEPKGLNVMKRHDTKVTAQAAAVAEPGATVAPVKVASKKHASPKKGAPKGRDNAKSSKSKIAAPKKRAAAKASKEPKLPRDGSKMATVIAMISKKGGATLDAIAKETGWQNHTVRGFMATLTRRAGIEFTSARRESDKARVYEAKGGAK
jgi:Protein of unknown function (DUF3489)